jgi:hypothetical protein
MSQFTAPLRVTPLNDGKTWIIITDDFRYDVGYEGSGDTVRVPQWMATDFASVPPPIWWFAAPWGKHGHAAVLHDAGYYLQDRPRAAYDRIFLEAMIALGVKPLKRRLMYLAVRLFGFAAWKGNRKSNVERPGWKIADPVALGLVTAPALEAYATGPAGAAPPEADRSAAPNITDVTEAVQQAEST